MATVSLVSDKLLATPAFVRDLTSFLNLSEDALLAISEFGNEPEGFVGPAQSQSLSARSDVPADQTTGILRVAKYLYDRVTELGLDVTVAVGQIDTIVSGLKSPVVIDDGQKNAIESILSFKRDYEISNANSKAVANAPHFSDINGSWSVKLLQTRTDEVVKVPVMSLNFIWHDGAGEHHEAFLQMSDKDWEEFSNKVKELTVKRTHLNEIL